MLKFPKNNVVRVACGKVKVGYFSPRSASFGCRFWAALSFSSLPVPQQFLFFVFTILLVCSPHDVHLFIFRHEQIDLSKNVPNSQPPAAERRLLVSWRVSFFLVAALYAAPSR